MGIRNHFLWLKISATFQILTAAMHSLSLIKNPTPSNDQEAQMLSLMSGVHMDLGSGFTPTMEDFMTSFSIAFTLLLLFAGVLNWFLVHKRAGSSLLNGIVIIQVIIFGLCFITMWRYTFIIPVICVGLIFIALLISWRTMDSPTDN